MSRDDPAPPRILIVEDEALVAMLIEDILGDLGYATAGPVARAADALAVLEAGDADAAVLDVNLDGESSYSIAEELARRGLPFVFLTGYGEAGIDPTWRGHPVVEKPFTSTILGEALAKLVFA